MFRVSNPFEAIPKNSGDVHEIEMVQGYAASMTADTFDLLATGGAPPSRAHDLLNVRYAVAAEPVAGWPEVYSFGGARVYENPGALPRGRSSPRIGRFNPTGPPHCGGPRVSPSRTASR